MAPVYVSRFKKNAWNEKAALLFEDEASFRQDSTLHQTWARVGHQPLIPQIGQRKSVKLFGCVEIFSAKLHYHEAPVFNAETYLDFLEQVARHYYPRRTNLIQDNASYHKDERVWEWFKANRSWLEIYCLPPYSPQFNAVERLWHHVRMTRTHNRYFLTPEELRETLHRILISVQRKPEQIRGYLQPFAA